MANCPNNPAADENSCLAPIAPFAMDAVGPLFSRGRLRDRERTWPWLPSSAFLESILDQAHLIPGPLRA